MITLEKKKIISKKVYIIIAAAVAVAAVTLLCVWGVLRSRKPILSLIGDKVITVSALDDYEDAGIKAKIGKEDISGRVVCDTDVNTKKVGDYSVVYSYKHNGKVYSAKRKVSVVDTVSPEITLKGDKKITVSLYKFYKEPGFKAVDKYDGDLTDAVKTEKIKNEDGTYKIVYSVSDTSGNEAKAERKIIVADKVAPKITLGGDYHTYIMLGKTFKDAGAKANDDVDGDISSNISKSGSVDTNTEGDYKIKYTVTDTSGNTATATRTVTVYKYDPSAKNRIYLTFDDGPSTNVTPKILDTLKKNNIKATFFIVNYSDDKKPLIKRMINEGHTIGIHGYSHDYGTIYKSEDAFMNNIYKLKNKLKKDFGYDATVIRFPGGGSNTVSAKYCKGIMTRLAKRVEAEGFTYFDWNVSSTDAEAATVATSKIISATTRGLAKNRGNVVLMHDINSKTTTAAALPEIIKFANRNGYVFLPITADTPPCHHSINN